MVDFKKAPKKKTKHFFENLFFLGIGKSIKINFIHYKVYRNSPGGWYPAHKVCKQIFMIWTRKQWYPANPIRIVRQPGDFPDFPISAELYLHQYLLDFKNFICSEKLRSWFVHFWHTLFHPPPWSYQKPLLHSNKFRKLQEMSSSRPIIIPKGLFV